jgi:hypothetical protein
MDIKEIERLRFEDWVEGFLKSDDFFVGEIGETRVDKLKKFKNRMWISKRYILNSWWTKLLYKSDLRHLELVIKVIDSMICDEMKKEREANGD